VLDVSYVGMKTRNNPRRTNLNVPDYGTTFKAAAQDPTKFAGGVIPATEAGLPLGQLICYQALRRLPDGAGLPENFNRHHTIAWMIQYRASFFSRMLIAEMERVARGTGQEQYVATLRDWWNAREAAGTVWQDFREQYTANTWKTAPFWVHSHPGEYLLLLGDRLVAPTNWVAPSEPRYEYLLFPRAVVEKALAVAVKQSEISLPPYAQVEFDIGGKAIAWPPRQAGKFNDHALPLLGQEYCLFKNLPLNTNEYPFRIRVSLASSEILYARQAQRTRWFGALIVVSVVAAVTVSPDHAHAARVLQSVEDEAAALLGEPGRALHRELTTRFNDGVRWKLHYVTAREMYNVVLAAVDGRSGDPHAFRDFRLAPPPVRAVPALSQGR